MSLHIVVIDYGSGNLRSVANALEKATENQPSSCITVSSHPSALHQATHIVLPGVGAFADCMHGLQAIPGMIDALTEEVKGKKKPFLGICVGMQLLMEEGHEHGIHKGLGWIEGKVLPLSENNRDLKIPHMGWNNLHIGHAPHPVLQGIQENEHAYFVHSFHCVCKQAQDVIATVDYGGERVAVLGRENIIATQFHPEKSQRIGLQLLTNFLAWQP